MAVRPSGQVKSVGSTATFRDGNWHHVVGTISADGMALYVDGVRVGLSAETKAGQAFGTRRLLEDGRRQPVLGHQQADQQLPGR